jgi:cobalt-zinc-cadmium efflux system outer membrane protein
LAALVACTALSGSALPALAQTAITEADVLAAVRARDPEILAARAEVAASAAREAGEGLYPNPSLAWEREEIPGDGPLAVHEDTFTLAVPIELGGARSARTAIAESFTAQARAAHALVATSAAQRALGLFYDALAAQQHSAIARDHLARLAEAERVLARRVAEGSASGYELSRLQLEAELARSTLSEREGAALAAIAELAFMLGLPSAGLELTGDLEARALGSVAVQSRALREADAAHSAAVRARSSAGSAWLPSLEAHGGPKLVGAGDDDALGYVAGLSIDLPLFDRKQSLTGEASARSAQLQAQRTALARSIEGARIRAEAELSRMRTELARFEQATGARVVELERAAEAAYREGRQTILELLDAQRMRASIEEQKLALRLSAKRAELALRAARGELEGELR